MLDFPVEWFDEIDSTNAEACRRVQSGQFDDVWIAAQAQSMGRGRLGREWKSPVGNLFATALFRFDGTMSDASKLPFVSALAVADVFDAFTENKIVSLKWPNDVQCDGSKLSGILIEGGLLESGSWVAVGIGINVSEAPEGLGRPTSCLAKLRGDNVVTPQIAFEELRQSFKHRFTEFANDFENTRQAWLQRADALGEQVAVSRGNENIEGVFEGVGKSGEMLLRLLNGELVAITAGDVELIKERTIT